VVQLDGKGDRRELEVEARGGFVGGKNGIRAESIRKTYATSLGGNKFQLATAGLKHGEYLMIEAVGRKGNVPPPHIHHREDAIFYILEGEIVVSVGDRTIKGTPGTMIFLPRDVRHSFTIESEQFRMLILVTPAGFEGWFRKFSVPAPAMTLPPANEPAYNELQRMLEAAPRYGLEFVLP
jgi:quercetin dioxygenase-like cupin family protein